MVARRMPVAEDDAARLPQRVLVDLNELFVPVPAGRMLRSGRLKAKQAVRETHSRISAISGVSLRKSVETKSGAAAMLHRLISVLYLGLQNRSVQTPCSTRLCLCQQQRQRQMKIITGSSKVVQGTGETQIATVLL